MNSEEFKDALRGALKEHLTIWVKAGGFTMPNERTVQVMFDSELIAESSFDISQRREYEG